MHLVQNFGLIIWCCFLLIMLSFAADNQNADVIKHCMNSTNSTSCSLTYEHVYKSLTKNENSFNISHALYPEGGKPSFLVRVNVYGPNKTHNSTPAQFIWSIHCLFSNVPALALEMLSLGSIIVTSRTQELDVQIPLFCCNLSENIERRKEMIQGFLTRALFELQDLAVSPDIRDPSLNSAQCVIQGHYTKFSDTKGHSVKMLWVCILFVMSAGLIVTSAIIDMNKFYRLSGRKIKNSGIAMCFSSHYLSVLGEVYFSVTIGCWWYLVSPGSVVLAVYFFFISSWITLACFLFLPLHSVSLSNHNFIGAGLTVHCVFGGNSICYISCWFVIGIRINPSWGLTVALFIISIFAAFTYAVYLYLEVIYPNGYNMRERENTLQDFLWGTYTLPEDSYPNPLSSSASNDDNSQNNNDDPNRVIAIFKYFALLERFRGIRAIFVCILGCIAVVCFFLIVILAGPSIAGQTSAADELLKTSSLYFITAFITWATLKKHTSIDTPQQNERTQNSEGQDTDHHTGDYPGGELGTQYPLIMWETSV